MLIFSCPLILLATYWPHLCGWLVMPALISLFIKKISCREITSWSIGLLAGHLWWVAHLAYHHMAAPPSGVLCLFGLLMLWFGVTTAVYWWGVYNIPCRWSRVRLAIALPFFFFLIAHATPFLSGIRGYPFLNPILPLIAWVQPATSIDPYTWQEWGNMPIYYLPPVKKNGRVATAQSLMMQINKIPLKNQGVILSPESTFCYPITSRSEELKWWRSVLPKNCEWLMGAVFEEKNQKNQSAIVVTNSPIIKRHNKHNCIDFFESTSKSSKLTQFLNKIIGWKTEKLAPAVEQGGPLRVARHLVHILLCSEALYAPLERKAIVLANESWFLPWVQECFFAALAWRACWQGCSILIIGHDRSLVA